MRRPAEVATVALLQAQALRLSGWAQRVRRAPVTAVADELVRLPWLPRAVRPEAARRAAVRAGRLLGRLGLLDSCLTRALVTGALLSDQPEVTLHVSVPQVSHARVVGSGHAWVCLAGENVTDGAGAGTPASPTEEILCCPLRRRKTR